MPVKLHIPCGSLLDPSPSAAVVGGSVLTTQRIVDVVLKAFGVCAASQVLQIGCFDDFKLHKLNINIIQVVSLVKKSLKDFQGSPKVFVPIFLCQGS